MKPFDFAFDYARDASTALNWKLTADRARISENLRTNADVIGAEMVHAKSAEERKYFFRQVERVYTRLALCDLVAAREAEAKATHEEREQDWCRSVLNSMATLLNAAAMNEDRRRDFLLHAQSSALRLELSGDVFSDGPEGRLLKLSETVGEMDPDRALTKYHALYEVLKMAKGFEQDKSPEAEEMLDDIFPKALVMLRRELGLDKESGRA